MAENRLELTFEGLYNSKDESKTPQGKCHSMSNCTVDNGILELGKRYTLFGTRTTPSSGDKGWGAGYGRYSGNEVQTMTVVSSGGDFTIKWRPTTSDFYTVSNAIPYNASSTDLQDILVAMSNISMGDVICEGGPLSTAPMTIEFSGKYSNTDVDLMVLNSSTLVGPATVTITETIKGGNSEEMLSVVQHSGDTTATLYSVNVISGTHTFLASGLNPSDWFFTQYAQKIYGVNATDGLNFKVLGGTWNGGATSQRPAAPQFAPVLTPTQTTPASTLPFQPGLSVGNFIGWGANPTSIVSGGLVYLTLGSSLNNQTVSFTVTTTGTPFDYSFRDAGVVVANSNDLNLLFDPQQTRIEFINNDASPATIEPNYYQDFSAGNYQTFSRWFQLANEDRALRDNIVKFRITLHITAAATGKRISVWLGQYDNWVNDTIGLNINDGPIRAQIEYAYSYFRMTDGTESPLSQSALTGLIPPPVRTGDYVQIAGRGSVNLTNTDLIYFYRKAKSNSRWKLLPNADGTYGLTNSASGGLVSYNDHRMEHELANLPDFGDSDFPGPSRGYLPRVVGVWKQCLGIGAKRQLFLSWQGQPQHFAPSPDDENAPTPDPDDLSRGVTEYVSDNRSEEVIGIHGQDSIYLVTPFSCYAKVGDSPAGATPPRRLPGSRGTLGDRSSWPLGGGVLLASQDGLWYYSVSAGFNGQDNGTLIQREETQEVRTSYSSLSASSSALVTEYNDEIWLVNGAKYLCNTRNKYWIEGTFTDSMRAVLSIRPLGLFFQDTVGRMLKVGTYTTDAGSSVTWSYSTGILDGPRVRIRGMEVRGSGRPTVTATVYDGLNGTTVKTYQKEKDGQNWTLPINLPPGYRYKLTFAGNSSETIEYAAIIFDESGPGKGN